jgi:hypothetical protein
MDYEDQELNKLLNPLRGKLAVWLSSRPRKLDRGSIHEINSIVQDEAVRVHQRSGKKLPPIVAIVLPSFGHIHLARGDMENAGIDAMIKNLIMEHRTKINGAELALAIRSAFPAYRHNKPMLIHA